MRKRLRASLTEPNLADGSIRAYNSFDIIGDIAVTKVPKLSDLNYKDIAEAIMNRHKNVKAIYVQETAVNGEFRLRKLNHVAGENRPITVHKESGCLFTVDVDKCYFSPRLSHERLRVASMVKHGETVINMFAGVGCFSILIAKNVSQTKVYSIDVNPTAIECLRENIRLNRVYGKVIPMLGDSKDIVNTKLLGVADRVLMPLPEKALEYLPIALSALKSSGGWVHYYDFEHARKNENPLEKTMLKAAGKLQGLGVNYKIVSSRIVRSTGPNWWQTALDIQVFSLPSKF